MQRISLPTNVLPLNQIQERIDAFFTQKKWDGKRILIVCEDVTRSTPVASFFKYLLKKLNPGTNQIFVLFACGSHRPMTYTEMLKKLGISSQEALKLKLMNHVAREDKQLIEIGKINNVSCKLNRAVVNADVLIGIGSVLPHRVMGFSGGAKIICPGIASRELIDFTHTLSNIFPEEMIIGQIDNPMRQFLHQIIDLLAKNIKLKMISINCVTVPGGIIDIFIGDFVTSYRQAADLSQKFLIKKVDPCKKILAFVDDKSMDFWQAAKAVYNCARVIQKDGLIVIRGQLSGGISHAHGKIINRFGYSTPETIWELIEKELLKDSLVASHMLRVSQHLSRVKIMISSPNLTEEQCKKVNLDYIAPNRVRDLAFDYEVEHAVDIMLTTSSHDTEN